MTDKEFTDSLPTEAEVIARLKARMEQDAIYMEGDDTQHLIDSDWEAMGSEYFGYTDDLDDDDLSPAGPVA